MKRKDLIDKLQKKFKVNTSKLQEILGHSNLYHGQNKDLTVAMIANFVFRSHKTAGEAAGKIAKSAGEAALKSTLENAILPIVEFFPVEKCDSTHGKKQELFNARNKRNSHSRGVYDALQGAKGVYVFFDSRGKAVYVGKAKRNLWNQMKSTFNRARGEVQSIYRVKHPGNNKKIASQQVPLHELAHYFSAYKVHPDIIDTVEALLIRTSANDLLNVRMENLGGKRK